MTYEEKPIRILNGKEHIIRNKTIPLVKVIWRNHAMLECTWELKDLMRILSIRSLNFMGESF